MNSNVNVHSTCTLYISFYTPALKKRGVYCFTSVCPSVSPSVHQSISPSVCQSVRRSHEYFRHIFLRNYNARISEIWFQGLYKSAIPCDAFSDSSLDNFLFTKHLYHFTHDGQVENFSAHFSQELQCHDF